MGNLGSSISRFITNINIQMVVIGVATAFCGAQIKPSLAKNFRSPTTTFDADIQLIILSDLSSNEK